MSGGSVARSVFLCCSLLLSFQHVNAQSLPTDYSCDPTVEAANAPRTAPLIFQLSPPPTNGTPTLTFERWPMLVDGQPNELNIAISNPAVGVPIRGVVITAHGIAPSFSSATPQDMANIYSYWYAQMAGRGYISVTVGRRGNFGSTGESLIDLVATGLLAKYHAGEIPYADLELAAWKYQSASLVAALQKMSTDPAYQPYLSTILLTGASGGANTVLQTAADSVVFQSATTKGLIRLTGADSAFDTNPDALPGVSEYSARIAKSTTSSLWIIGEDDPITSAGQVACQFKFFNQAAGFPNSLYLVPGMGHGGEILLFTPTLWPPFEQYMTSQGFLIDIDAEAANRKSATSAIIKLLLLDD